MIWRVAPTAVREPFAIREGVPRTIVGVRSTKGMADVERLLLLHNPDNRSIELN
jgi:hypothetical protein